MLKKLCILFLVCFSALQLKATHNRAGEITYKQIGPLTFEITLITFTDPSTMAHQQRTELYFSFSDNTQDTFPRISETLVGTNISKNEYIGVHTFPAVGTYIIAMEDPNRNAGVVNIPNSVDVSFYLESILMINPLIGNNSSPILLNSPIDKAVVGIPFIHNPSAFDSDGDSLSYTIISSKGENGNDIIGYQFPDASNSLSIDASGNLIWDSPTMVGEYNIAILIEEWRNGVKVGSIVRDMQITVAPNTINNSPPKIEVQPSFCVIAGDTLKIPILAWDEDSIFTDNFGNFYWGSSAIPFGSTIVDTAFQKIKLSGSSGLFTFSEITDTQSISTTLNIPTFCADVRKNPFQLVLKVKEQSHSAVALSTMQSVEIKIIAPAVENVKIDSVMQMQKAIAISWDASICSNATSYLVYRKEATSNLALDSCTVGMASGNGFQFIRKVIGLNNTTFVDDNNGNGLGEGVNYCYRIVTKFLDGAESIVSEEACAELLNFSPLITNVSVHHPDSINAIYIAWSKPKDISFSSNAYYELSRSDDGQNFNLIYTSSGINDTIYFDGGITANSKQYFYKIQLLDGTLVGESTSSSQWLTLNPQDNAIAINIESTSPWQDTAFVIFRKNPNAVVFDSIATIIDNFYLDDGLKNGETYCYFVKAIGRYSGTKTISPLINLSNNSCAFPTDSTPPCPPEISIVEDCKNSQLHFYLESDSICLEDTEIYTIYLLSGNDKKFITTMDSSYYFYENLNSLAGCYVVTATDSFGNESIISNQICVENCPEYELPNVFSPNADNVNDLFVPIKNKHIESVDMKIFNRWGKMVFETTDAEINWNGQKRGKKSDCSEGVYFYVCTINELKLNGIISSQIRGTVSLIRGNTKKAD
ncbi:MAG: gliding motility-associated C-terminal domain-containing protein [Flavobacteriales bacterium]|nr:gliding motility-associated C-terminal domain-containing protein [Flavobacteriales bacterium]